MEKKSGTRPGAGPDQQAGDAAAVLHAGAGSDLAATTMALQAEVLNWFFYWCSPHAWGKWAVSGGSAYDMDASRCQPHRTSDSLMPAVVPYDRADAGGAESAATAGVCRADAAQFAFPEDDDDVMLEDEAGLWTDVVDNVAPDPLAHMPAGEFNVALHALQEQVCSGQFAREHPYELPPGYKPVLRPWPKDRRTEPYEL